MDNDFKKNAIVIREINYKPKCYYDEILTDEGQIKYKHKCGGIPQAFLNNEMYINGDQVEIKMERLKKVHIKPTKKDKENGVKCFAIKEIEMSRTFNKTTWVGMNYKDNIWTPNGFDGCPIF